MFRIRLAAAATLAVFAVPSAAAPATVVVDMWSFGFAPRPIHLAAGRPVTLTFVNRSGGGHDFTAPAFFAAAGAGGAAPGGKVALGPHQARTITLTPRAGTYDAICTHLLHKQLGMRTQVIVD